MQIQNKQVSMMQYPHEEWKSIKVQLMIIRQNKL